LAETFIVRVRTIPKNAIALRAGNVTPDISLRLIRERFLKDNPDEGSGRRGWNYDCV
jgi:hypothetical protein